MSLSPGLHTISMAEYLADPCERPSLTASIANCILTRSPAHARMLSPRLYAGFEREEDSRFDLGSAAHRMLLERTGEGIEFIAANDWRTNAAKEARDAARAVGKLPVLIRYRDIMVEMVRTAREAINNSEFAGLLDAGLPEQTVVATETNAYGSYWMRCRPDWWSQDRRISLHYKTCDSADPDTAGRQIGNLGYDVALSFYQYLMRDHGCEHQVLLMQEVDAPFACSIHMLANTWQEIADEKRERAVTTWSMCMASGKWPSYPLQTHHQEPPGWMMAEYDARLNATW